MVVKLFYSVYGWLIGEVSGCLVAWNEWRSPGNTRHSKYTAAYFLFVFSFRESFLIVQYSK
jgi:hypothetical protein